MPASMPAGEPTGESRETVRQVIKNAKGLCQNSQYGPGAVAFQFAQAHHPGAAGLSDHAQEPS